MPTVQKKFTDRTLQALKPAAAGGRYELRDTEVTGLRVIVNDKGRITFALLARFPGGSAAVRRPIATYNGEDGAKSLAQARKVAREWRALIDEGKDPKRIADDQRRGELRKQADTVEAVFSLYEKRVLLAKKDGMPKQRRGHHVSRELRREFISRWSERPITAITSADVKDVLHEIIDRGAPTQARNLLSSIRTFFSWVVDTDDYGLEASPCDRIRPKVLIGEKKPRQRVLSDAEIVAFWKATGRMGYPFASSLRLMLLTGARENEIAKARWREIDASKGLLAVPPERFKSGATHLVPLSAKAEEIVRQLPRFAKGDFLFSTSYGERPSTGFSRAKARLDRLMAEELGGSVDPFTIHDLRRTLRTRLASLRVPDSVAELVVGHAKRGIQRTYDVWHYLDEMRQALEQWAALLGDIVTPPSSNVVKYPKRA